MAELTRETLAELRRLRDAATPGEWLDGWWQPWFMEAGRREDDDAPYVMLPPENAMLARAVVNALPALLAAAERGLDVEGKQ